MKVIFASFSDNYDHQMMMYQMAEKMQDRDIHVCTIGVKEPKYTPGSSFDKVFLKMNVDPGINLNLINPFIYIRFAFTLLKVRPKKLFLLSSHTMNIVLILLLKLLFIRCEVIHSVHDYIPHKGDSRERGVQKYNELITRICHKVILYNPEIIDSFSRMYNYEKVRIVCINYWKVFRGYTPPPGTKTFLFFGRMNYYKGVNHIEEIVRDCKGCNFKIVGRFEKTQEIYLESLKSYDNTEVIPNYVFGSDMDKVFEESDWVILPYNSATVSGVIIDAYRFSRPVIAFGVGGIVNQVSCTSGFTIEPSNITQFKDTVKKVSEFSEDDNETYSKNAYKFGEIKYSLDSVAQDFYIKFFGGEENDL